MRFAVMLPQSGKLATPAAIVDVAQAAEELGFDAVSVRDHLVFDGAYITSGMRGLAIPGDDRTMFEALETLTFVASRTSRVRLGTSVLILPNRHPLLLAKQVSTLDHLTGGRVILGLGIGPNRREAADDTTKLGTHRDNLAREYDTFGAFGPRGPRMDEYFEAMVRLWTEERPSFKGEYVHFDDVLMFPKPAQKPYPPILVGGRSGAARARAARWDAGWLPSQVTTGEIEEGVADLRRRQIELGRDEGPGTIGVNMHSIIAATTDEAVALAGPTLGSHFADRQTYLDRTLSGDLETFTARVAAYRDAGVDYVELKPVVASIDDLIDQLRQVHETVMPAVA